MSIIKNEDPTKPYAYHLTSSHKCAIIITCIAAIVGAIFLGLGSSCALQAGGGCALGLSLVVLCCILRSAFKKDSSLSPADSNPFAQTPPSSSSINNLSSLSYPQPFRVSILPPQNYGASSNTSASSPDTLPLEMGRLLAQLGWTRLRKDFFKTPQGQEFQLSTFLEMNLNLASPNKFKEFAEIYSKKHYDCDVATPFFGSIGNELLLITSADLDAVIELAKMECAPPLCAALINHKEKLIKLKEVLCENFGFGPQPNILEMLSFAANVFASPWQFDPGHIRESPLNRPLFISEIIAKLKQLNQKQSENLHRFPYNTKNVKQLFINCGFNIQDKILKQLSLLDYLNGIIDGSICINDQAPHYFNHLFPLGLYLVKSGYENEYCLSSNPESAIENWGEFAKRQLLPTLLQRKQQQ